MKPAIQLVLSLAIAAGAVLAAEPGKTPDDPKLAEAIQQLVAAAEQPVPGLRIPDKDPRLPAIQTLTAAGNPQAVAGLLTFLKLPYGERKIKQEALLALGRIGTPQAIGAITEFEQWAAERHAKPSVFRFGENDYPIAHFQALDLEPEARLQGKDGTTWACFENPYIAWKGGRFLTSSTDGKLWAPPVFVGEIENPQQVLQQVAAGDMQLEGLARDSDRDGLSDAVEQRLGTDPHAADSDGDGVPDGADDNPLTPRSKDAPDDLAQIRQALFFMTFATSNSRDVIIVTGPRQPGPAQFDLRRQEFHGYSGWLIPAETSRRGWVNLTAIDVKIAGDSAEASISDYEGDQARAVWSAKLRKLHGKWVVTDYQLKLIS